MDNARLTVCIPAYNQPRFLHEALASLCDQGLRRDQYVVAISDDASPTSLAPVAASFDDKLQIVFHRNETNIGHLANFERSSRLSETELLTFLPHDDLIAPGHLGRALAAIEQDPAAVLVASLVLCQRHPGAPDTRPHGIFLRGAARATYTDPYVWDQAEWMALALTTTPLSIVGSVFRAEPFRNCQSWNAFPLWHDRLMLAEIGLHGRVISLPWIAGYYRVGTSQLSVQLWTTDMKEFAAVSGLILDLCASKNIPVIEFWIEQICQAPPAERVLYLQMLNAAVPSEVFQTIKAQSEGRLHTRLYLGRLDRLGIPRAVADLIRRIDRLVGSRQ